MSEYWAEQARARIRAERAVDTALAALPWALVVLLLWRIARGH